MRTILIAGCGYVGSHLARLLLSRSDRVIGLRRNPAELPAGVEPYAGDLGDRESLEGLPGHLHAVVYTASADSRTEDAYRRAYVSGPRALLETLAEKRVKLSRFLFTSSTAVYAQTGGEWVDETSATDPSHFSGQILLEAERVVAQAGHPFCVVRLGGIYGPGRTRLIESVASGTARYDEGAFAYTNRIHRDDAARALLHLLDQEEPDVLYLGTDGQPAPRAEVLGFIAEKLGVSSPAGANRHHPGPTGKRCRADRLLKSGFELRFPSYREGYAALVQQYGRHRRELGLEG